MQHDQIDRIIETLEQDLPTLFERDISYDIYAPTIFFKDPVNTFKGKFNYRIIFWTLRFHGKLFFTELFFDLHKVYPVDPATILAEWTVRGTLRVPWKARVFFNGTSTYRLNDQQLIDNHLDVWDRSPNEILKQFFQSGTNLPE